MGLCRSAQADGPGDLANRLPTINMRTRTPVQICARAAAEWLIRINKDTKIVITAFSEKGGIDRNEIIIKT